ncbi:MAG: hypothetical protein BRC28_03190 [Nanohaloarchaea archaeon SW_4_43_9]|nr:MAG: hypothetical protein BRC28_03190 [Nanohaloarchaea archaeon SW_4_43_9]
MSKVLVVAFDGVDKELIEEFKLDNIPQKEFGTIDNSTDVTTIVTYELFASFITGGTWKDHGVIGLTRPENNVLNSLENLRSIDLFQRTNEVRKKLYNLVPLIDGEFRRYNKKDLDSETFFEKIASSKAIDVPSYNLGYSVELMPILEKYGLKEAEKELDRFTNWKRWELFDEMEKDHDLIMAHFHKPDHIHHWYWEVGKMDKVEETYHEMDEFAGEILEKAEENGFDTVIFMSDHGLPDVENGGHNENAFYSCNHELFGDETPHITDFNDKILDLTDRESAGDVVEEINI